MKYFFILLMAVTNFASAQNNNNMLSMDGIGSIKLSMSQEALEKLLNKKVPLSNPQDTVSGSWQDSAKVRYGNMQISLMFQRNYFAPDTFNMIIIGIKTNSALCRTAQGIGIGTDKLRIIAAYEDYIVTLQPGYDPYDAEINKTQSMISIRNSDGDHLLRFFLFNKKVVGFEIAQFFSDSE